MRARFSRRLMTSAPLLAALLAGLPVPSPAGAAPPPQPSPSPSPSPSNDGRGWLGEELPLPLAVRTAQDLAVKAAAEKQYLIFNLLAGGKLAWDQGDFATAAAKWEALLRVHGLDPDIEKVIRPLAKEARGRAGGAPASNPPPVATTTPTATPESTAIPEQTGARAAAPAATVSGTVSGGGSHGPGGAVIWLKRIGGETPRPSSAHSKVITQRNKTFIPHVLVVPVGTRVSFRNEDPIFHNVFSLSKPNDFDTGLYKQGASYEKTFKHAGVVQVLCNIHSAMLGVVVVVDTPYYAQADGAGAFTIKGVPPGEYELKAWHEAASKVIEQRVNVGANGVRGLALQVGGDKRAPQFVPDKSGKPRQSHLGY
jgi:plastocyanin